MLDTLIPPGQEGGSTSGPSRERGIDRLVVLLQFLHQHGRPIRIGDLARDLEAPRSSTYDLVKTLTQSGLLETMPDGSVFFGKTLYFYGLDYLREHDFVRRGRDEVDRLARETGETSQFCMLHHGQYTVVHMRAGSRPFRISSDIGTQIPAPWTASGRLLFGNMSDAEITAQVRPADLVTPNGQSLTLEEFITSVRKARADGFCVTSGLVDAYTHCLAAAVLDHEGRTAATLCFVVPVDTDPGRMDELLAVLMASAKDLSVNPPDRTR